MLLFLRNFVSVCSQKLPKCNKPDNRHAGSKFHNFTTITNLTLVERADQLMKNVVHLSKLREILQRFETVFVCLFVCLGARAEQNVQFVNL